MVKVDSSTMMVIITRDHSSMIKLVDKVNFLEREEFIKETFQMAYQMEKDQKLG